MWFPGLAKIVAWRVNRLVATGEQAKPFDSHRDSLDYDRVNWMRGLFLGRCSSGLGSSNWLKKPLLLH